MESKRLILPSLLHGGDYNPDQWLHDPAILAEDIRLMKLAGCNVMSIGIFAWSALEPTEGVFDFAWLDGVINSLHAAGISIVLATPSGARPAWLAKKYPEVLRVTADRERRLFGERHNHCPSSPVYREKVTRINGELSRRYGSHPGVILWHISNEYSGECHCPLCQAAFRDWLRKRYGSLLVLNRAWWNGFWSHNYSSWDEIESPSPLGETMVHGLNLDWKRFVSWITVDFMKAEIASVRTHSPDVPVTTNLMGTFDGLDYWKLAEEIDVVSWDSYPCWHGKGPMTLPWAEWDPSGKDDRLAANIAFLHDLNRSLKRRPFLLMESTPSATNWQPVAKLKRPRMHELVSLQAVAHGSDSVQYFQWRKSRGGFEKFHGAVVDHAGHENTRVFREVAALGKTVAELSDVAGSRTDAKVALLFDWDNRWALEDAKGPLNDGRMDYRADCIAHYRSFWKANVAVDVVNADSDYSPYRILVAPMLYMVSAATAERIASFVAAGGTFVTTYWSGIVDGTDLCHLGGFPGPLRKVLGIWAEEIDALYLDESRRLSMVSGNPLGMEGDYSLTDLWESVHLEGARELARFQGELFDGQPALTMNSYGEGKAYYIASRNEETFLDAFYGSLIREVGVRSSWPSEEAPPEGVSVVVREGERSSYYFVLNFADGPRTLPLPDSLAGAKILVGESEGKALLLPHRGRAVLRLDRD